MPATEDIQELNSIIDLQNETIRIQTETIRLQEKLLYTRGQLATSFEKLAELISQRKSQLNF